MKKILNKDFVNNFNVIEKNTINSGALIHIEHEQLIDHLKNEDTNQVISLIGVLEHVEDPVKLLTELKNIGFDYVTPCSGGWWIR